MEAWVIHRFGTIFTGKEIIVQCIQSSAKIVPEIGRAALLHLGLHQLALVHTSEARKLKDHLGELFPLLGNAGELDLEIERAWNRYCR